MRGVYLKPCDSGRPGSSRGGVGSTGDDYELEIGQSQNASAEMLAHCAMIDEIHEFLRKTDSPLSNLILRQHRTIVDGLEAGLAAARDAEREQEAGRQAHERTLAALAERFGPNALDACSGAATVPPGEMQP